MTAFAEDPNGEDRKLLPIRVKKCKPKGLLKSIIYIDLVDLDENTAGSKLLSGIESKSLKTKKSLYFQEMEPIHHFFRIHLTLLTKFLKNTKRCYKRSLRHSLIEEKTQQ